METRKRKNGFVGGDKLILIVAIVIVFALFTQKLGGHDSVDNIFENLL